VTPCNLDTNVDLNIGNVMKNNPKEIYESMEYQRIRKASIARKISPCSTCHDANYTHENRYVYAKK
jgi:hypothetical protein